jgi:hypothetical protein
MRKISRRRNQLEREAAIALFLCAGFIVGCIILVLRFTTWRQLAAAAEVPLYAALPGVNMANLPPAAAGAVVKKLNLQRCHCGCLRSVAGCRNRHDSCTESIVAAQDEVNAARPH